jgi:hypothetical protein
MCEGKQSGKRLSMGKAMAGKPRRGRSSRPEHANDGRDTEQQAQGNIAVGARPSVDHTASCELGGVRRSG